MANTPLVNGIITITATDINGNRIAKTFNSLAYLNFDYGKGMLNVVDFKQGSFFFSLTAITSLTYTIVANPGGSHTIVTS
jgi:hypothetical protein